MRIHRYCQFFQICAHAYLIRPTVYACGSLGYRIENQDEFGSTCYLWAEDQSTLETCYNHQKVYFCGPHSFGPVALVSSHRHFARADWRNRQNNVWKVESRIYDSIALKRDGSNRKQPALSKDNILMKK